jgi:hypothetical protein
MMNIALVKNNVIENIVIVESLESTADLFPEYEVQTLVEDNIIGIGWYRVDSLWYPPKPSESHVWNEERWTWVLNESTETPSFEHSPEYLSEQ